MREKRSVNATMRRGSLDGHPWDGRVGLGRTGLRDRLNVLPQGRYRVDFMDSHHYRGPRNARPGYEYGFQADNFEPTPAIRRSAPRADRTSRRSD